MIATLEGEKPIEFLAVGDRVATLVAGEIVYQPVVWVGSNVRKVNAHAPDDLSGYPVRVRAHAFAPNVPDRDLLVTSEHSFFFEGGLVPVRMLVNEASIVYDKAFSSYTHYHIKPERHAIVQANKAWTESFLDTGDSLLSYGHERISSGAGAVESAPTSLSWSEGAVAPLRVERDFVEPIFQSLVARCALLGLTVPKIETKVVEDADLH